jgi:small conductance mechanosensitive channel
VLIDATLELGSVWGLRGSDAFGLLIVGRIVCGNLRRATRHALEESSVDAALVPFVASLVYYATMAVVVIAVPNLFGIQTASVIAVLGDVSLAVGPAMQGTLSDFAAGVMQLVFRPFELGDRVGVAGTAGSVFEIGVFSTVLHTGDDIEIMIPNSSINGDTVKNHSANESRRVAFAGFSGDPG